MAAIREELELDVSPALKAVDQIDSALGEATQGFKASLLDAISVLQSITVEADTSALESQLAAVTSEEITVTADTAPAEQEISALDDSVVPVDVPVEADTAQAQQEIDALEQSATGAEGSLANLTNVTQGFQISAGLAGGSAAELENAVSALAPAAAVVAGSLGAVATVTGLLFTSAVAAEGAVTAFNTTLGNLAGPIRNLQIGQLNIDLAKLAEQLGSDDEAALTAAQRIAQLGISSGAADSQIITVTQSIVKLAANARSLNPSLGSVAEITDRLGTALGRGGRFLAQYGISLTQEEIKAEAAAETGKALNATFSQFELRAAGAKLALDKVGPSIEANIAKAGENAVITLDRLKEELRNAFEALGTPIIAPGFDLLKAALPVATELAGALGGLGKALIPVATAIVKVVEPLTAGLADGVARATPGLVALSEAIADVGTALVPVATVLGDTFALFGQGAGLILEIVSPLVSIVAPLAAIYAGLVLFNLALTALDAHPVIAVATAVILVAGAIRTALNGASESAEAFTSLFNEVASQASTLDSALLGNAQTIDELKVALDGTNTEFGVFLATQSEFSKNVEASTALRKVGEDVGVLRGQLEDGETGFREFVSAAVQAGQVTIKIDGLEQSAGDILLLDDAQQKLFADNGKAIVQGEALVSAFNKQQLATEQLAQEKINELALSGQVTQAQIEAAGAAVQAAGGTFTYAKELRQLVQDAPGAAGAADALNAALQAQNQTWIDLGKSISDATSQNQAIVTAQNAVANSAIALASAQREVAALPRQIAAANREQRSAQLDLADAQRALRDLNRQYLSDLNAQKSAAFALVDAQRALADAQRQPAKDANAIASAQLDVRSAQLGVVDAQEKLNELRADPNADPEELAKAEIELGRAQLEQSNSALRLADAQEQASLQGENLAKAQLNVSNAQLAVDAANQKVAEHAEAVEKANLAIADASDRVAAAADNAAAAIERQQTAYQNLALAILNNAATIKLAADAAADAVTKAALVEQQSRQDKGHRDPLAQFDNVSNLVANTRAPAATTNGVNVEQVTVNVTPTGDPSADRAAGAAAAQGFLDAVDRAHVRVTVNAS